MASQKDILIVEDDAPMRELISMSLQEAGFRVREATGQSARQHVAAQADAIVVAVNSPKTMQDNLVAELRARFPSAALIAVSGYFPANTDTSRALATELGVERTLSKPFKREQLIALVSELTGTTAKRA